MKKEFYKFRCRVFGGVALKHRNTTYVSPIGLK